MSQPQYKTVDELRASPRELLQLIIDKAKRSGFRFKNFIDDYDSFIITAFNPETGRMAFVLRNNEELRVVYDSIYLLFFDVTFAKSLFGDNWELHLKELAESDNKIEYLTNNILISHLYA